MKLKSNLAFINFYVKFILLFSYTIFIYFLFYSHQNNLFLLIIRTKKNTFFLSSLNTFLNFDQEMHCPLFSNSAKEIYLNHTIIGQPENLISTFRICPIYFFNWSASLITPFIDRNNIIWNQRFFSLVLAFKAMKNFSHNRKPFIFIRSDFLNNLIFKYI